MELIVEVQTDEFWQDVTTSMLEDVRKRLRSLVKFIEKTKRPNIYTDFVDAMGEEHTIELPGLEGGFDRQRFRDKTEQYFKAHENDPVIVNAGSGTTDEMARVRSRDGLGLFVRSMVGLDREAAKRAFDGFLNGRILTATQIQFVNVIIDSLTQSGWMRASQLYESPFTDFSPKGIEGVFSPEQVTQLIGVLDKIRSAASV